MRSQARGGVGERSVDRTLLAARGFAALALAYFNLGSLPREMVDIPLEYFATALAWLGVQPDVRPEAIAVLGSSRGGELALLLGATFPRIRAVVGIVPSHVVNAGTEGGLAASRPAWSFGGRSLRFVSRAHRDPAPEHLGRDAEPIALTPSFLEALADAEAVERATIPVERIQGPVLVVSGRDDQMWPSTLMAQRVVERLARHRHPFPFRHRAYDGAGHFLSPPTCPRRSAPRATPSAAACSPSAAPRRPPPLPKQTPGRGSCNSARAASRRPPHDERSAG